MGRNYHSGSLLLPDGRVMIFGSDSLFADKANTKPGVFEQRIEIYTPPYLYRDVAADAVTAAGRRRSSAARRRRSGPRTPAIKKIAADAAQLRHACDRRRPALDRTGLQDETGTASR